MRRRTVARERRLELVALHLPAPLSLGLETHVGMDQTFIVLAGSGIATVGDRTVELKRGDALVVLAGTPHDLRATEDLHLYTVYTPVVPGVFDHGNALKDAREALHSVVKNAPIKYNATLVDLLRRMDAHSGGEHDEHAALLVGAAQQWVDFLSGSALIEDTD